LGACTHRRNLVRWLLRYPGSTHVTDKATWRDVANLGLLFLTIWVFLFLPS